MHVRYNVREREAKKTRQLRRETSSYGRTMNNEIAGISLRRMSTFTIRLITQATLNALFCLGVGKSIN
ncbi:hypothetical protein D0683_19185 [Escherichia albertii]|nr:hypothetical protein [Escherichia albertii]